MQTLSLLVAMALSHRVLAADAIRLPLDGYYRPGRCMPVEVLSRDGVTLVADGAVPTLVAASRTGIVPVLVLEEHAGDLLGHRLRSLKPEDRLIGVASADPSGVEALFPGDSLVPVPIDPGLLAQGPRLAWESLDAVVVDRPAPAIADWLGQGTTIVVRSPERPDHTWPWERLGACWVLRPRLAGPTSALAGEVAYLPAIGWEPSPTPAERRNIVLAGILVSIVAMSTLLVRRRWLIWTVAAAMLCTTGVVAWRMSLPGMRVGTGCIVVTGPLQQRDLWRYCRGLGDSTGSIATGGKVRPQLLDPRQAADTSLRLVCPAGSADHWQFDLRRGRTLAFLDRSVTLNTFVDERRPSRASRLHELARLAYLKPGLRIAGERGAGGVDRWPDVIIAAP